MNYELGTRSGGCCSGGSCLSRVGLWGGVIRNWRKEAVASVEFKAGNSESWIAKDGERNWNVLWNEHDRLSGESGAKKDVKNEVQSQFLLKTNKSFGSKPFFGFKAILGRKLSAAMLLKKISRL